jgi:hypothetical protein
MFMRMIEAKNKFFQGEPEMLMKANAIYNKDHCHCTTFINEKLLSQLNEKRANQQRLCDAVQQCSSLLNSCKSTYGFIKKNSTPDHSFVNREVKLERMRRDLYTFAVHKLGKIDNKLVPWYYVCHNGLVVDE